MRSLPLLLVLLVLQQPPLPVSVPARAVRQTPALGVIYVIVNTPEGTPVEDADVTLRYTPPPRVTVETGAFGDTTQVLGKTDAAGRAVFRNLEPGNYSAAAERQGFLPKHASAGAVRLDGSSLSPPSREVRLVLARGATVSGRVRDSRDQPAPNTRVELMRVRYQDGERSLARVEGPGFATTNDLGEFRFFWLPSGEYYVRATRPNPNATVGGYTASTYYPGVIGPKLAKAIMVRDGDNIDGVSLTLSDKTGVTVSGRVVSLLPPLTGAALGADGSPVRFLFLAQLIPVGTGLAEEPMTQLAMADLRIGIERELPFEIRDVPAGEYDLYPFITDRSSGTSIGYTGRTRILVGNDDVKDIVATVDRGVEVRGQFRSADGSPLDLPEILQIGLIPHDTLPSMGGFGQSSFLVEGKPEFKIPNLLEARYQLASVSNLLGRYVSDIRVNGRSVFDDGVIDVRRAPIDLEVIIAQSGGEIEGTVEPLPPGSTAAFVTVVLIPDSPRRGNALLHRQARFTLNPRIFGTSSDFGVGSFDFYDIAPGSYKVFAWEDLPSGGAERNPEFLREYERRGVAVVVAPGASIKDLQIPIIRAP